ncbi:hypothetical protein H4Q26_008571 [Puccinia striiformis f. sp. tritici PST-130]|nr:hypothetical protein H4Q26_008571 [Puccinia striiformis f. sp. tritici PST-130]
MDDPVKELKEVIRSITEPFSAREIAKNVDKYFTEDAFIMYPLFNQPQTANSRENLKGIYKLLRVFSYHGKIDFHAVMFSEDRLNATVDLTETIQPRLLVVCLSNSTSSLASICGRKMMASLEFGDRKIITQTTSNVLRFLYLFTYIHSSLQDHRWYHHQLCG